MAKFLMSLTGVLGVNTLGLPDQAEKLGTLGLLIVGLYYLKAEVQKWQAKYDELLEKYRELMEKNKEQ